MIVCPNCSSENEDHEPHCGTCGRPLTFSGNFKAPEGLAAALEIPSAPTIPTRTPRTTPIDPLAGASDKKTSASARTVQLGAIPGDLAAALTAVTDNASGDQSGEFSINDLSLRVRGESSVASGKRNTFVEGIPAITMPEPEPKPDPKPAPTPSLGTTQTINPQEILAQAPKAVSKTPEPDPEPPTKRLSTSALAAILLALLLLLGVAIGIAVTFFENDTNAETLPDPPTGRADIPEGPFLKGLANDYRLMFSQTCKKVADDPETECKEDIGLKGEVPQEEIKVAAFAMDRAEVTHGEWAACVEEGACAAIDLSECGNYTLQGKVPFRRVPQSLAKPERPVICVSQKEAEAFCTWRGGRLPTEDEWEKAARGVDGYTLPWGTKWNPVMANWGERDMARTLIAGKLDGHVDTAPVGAYPKGVSPYGLHDMAGNVAEWVSGGQTEDGALIATARGGSWRSSPLDLRVTRRLFLNPDERRTDVGFRCAYAPQ